MSVRTNTLDGVSLRTARPSDRDFARRLYFDSMRQRLTALGTWNEGHVAARFRAGFKLAQAKVIRQGHARIGWMQVTESAHGFHLNQLHLIEEFRNNGIGTWLIRKLQGRARRKGSTVALNVIRGNPATALYRRLGFRTVSWGEEKIHMRWEAARVRRG